MADWLRIAGVVVIALKLALVPVVFDPLGENAFDVAKSVTSRSSMYLLLCIGGMLLLTSAEARRRVLRSRPTAAGLIAFGAVAGLATLLAVHPPTALFGAHHRYLGLSSLADGITLAFALPLFIAHATDLRIVLVGLFGGASIVVGYSGVQMFDLDPLSWTDSTSTLGNRGVYAGYLVVLVGAAAIRALGGPLSRWTLALTVMALGASALVVLSTARGPILALPLVLGVVAIIALRCGWRATLVTGRLRIVAVAVSLIVVLSLTGTLAAPRLAALLSGGDASLLERSVVYESAARMIAARPVLGSGPDHFAVLYPRLRPAAAAEVLTEAGQTSAHSWPIQQAIGTGLVGLLVLGLLIFASIRRAWLGARHDRSGALALGAVILVAFLLQGVFNISSVGTDFLFWTGIGLTASAPFSFGDDGTKRLGGRWKSLAIPALAVAIGLLLASTTVNWLGSNRAVHSSNVLRLAGDFPRAEAAALVATQLDPGRANNWNVLGLARSPASPRRALLAFERARELAPYESRYLVNVIKEEARLGEADPNQMERARTHALTAVEIDPRNAETHRVLSFLLLKTGDPAGARREAELAIGLAPKDPQSYSWSAAIHEDAGDLPKAAARYQDYYDLTTAGGAEDPVGRYRLALLYARAGLLERARPLARPRVIAVRKTCDRECREIIVHFDTPFGLATEGPGGARDTSKYRIDGRALPADTVITVSERRTLLISRPPSRELLRQGSTLEISGVTDTVGFPIDPDPALLTVP